MGFRGLLFVVSALFATPCAGAQDADSAYPTRHIRLIAPFSAGSTLDIMSRLVAKAPPDGHTMLITTGSFMGNIVLYRKLPYDGIRDFAPITRESRAPPGSCSS